MFYHSYSLGRLIWFYCLVAFLIIIGLFIESGLIDVGSLVGHHPLQSKNRIDLEHSNLVKCLTPNFQDRLDIGEVNLSTVN